MDWLAWYPWIPMALSWFTMFIETFYFAGMWIPRLRVYWLGGIIALHMGIGLFLGLYLFGLVMILLSLSAFGYDIWRELAARRPTRRAPDSAAPPGLSRRKMPGEGQESIFGSLALEREKAAYRRL
jgi:hypothetical protein